MPPEIKRVSKKYMKTPVEITVGKMNTASKNVDHQFYVASSHHRYEALKRLIDLIKKGSSESNPTENEGRFWIGVCWWF